MHRVARLTGALSLAPDELFAALDALGGDPSIAGHNTFDVLIDTPPGESDCYRILAGGSVPDGLWLVQTLVAVVRWMQATDLDGTELNAILGGTADQPAQEAERLAAVAVLDEVYQQLQPVLLAPQVFVSERFDERSARVVHEVLTGDGRSVSAKDPRLVRVDDWDGVASAAYACLLRLPVIEERDFVGLGLAEHVQQKIFTNLVLRGYLQADGAITESRLPASEDGFALVGNFDAVGATVFELIGELCQEADGDDVAVVPSDLEPLETLSPAERAEVYDNLIFNRYLDTDGTVLWAAFFMDPENAGDFWVNADIGAPGPAVWRNLRERVAAFDTSPVALDTAIFEGLRLPAGDLESLVESLRFNGYLDANGGYVDKRALLRLRSGEFNLAPDFFPHRQAILDAVQAQLDARRSTICTTSPEDLTDLADQALAARILAELEGTYLVDGRVPDDDDDVRVRFRDGGPLGLWLDLDAAADATICGRIAAVLAAQQPYHLDRAALADLDLDDGDVNLLAGALTLAGDLSADLSVPYDRVAYFGDARRALDYTVEGFEDFSTDVFFLLHAVATELAAGTAEITRRLEEHAGTQRRAFLGALQDTLGIPADTVEAICRALCGDVPDALDDLLAPVLAAGDGAGRVEAEPADTRFRRLYRRLARFALLAAKLGLNGDETEVAFRDQDLVGKFPEPLALPAGITRIDALLPSGDGHVYLFADGSCWRYAPVTFEREDPDAVPLRTLSERFADLARVDAAFVDAPGAEWLVGHDRSGRSCTFRREAGSSRWVATPRTWGLIKNNFADPERIDTAFRDAEGKTYLFSGDQYVRYSGDDYAQVDEGFPRTIAGNLAAEGLQVALPPGFETSVDASFQGLDGRAYLFAGGQYAASGDAATRPVRERWGRVRNAFLDAGRIDAAYAEASALYLLLGDQVVRYVDCIENGGVQVDEGYPRRLEQYFPDLPVEFETGIEAAFADPGGAVYLFKDGRTVTPGNRIVGRVDRR